MTRAFRAFRALRIHAALWAVILLACSASPAPPTSSDSSALAPLIDQPWRWIPREGRPFPSREALLSYDAARQRVVLFDQVHGGDTWTWDGTTWTRLTPAAQPPERQGASFAFDAARSVSVLFGSTDYGDGKHLRDTWLWNGTSWTAALPATSPPGPGSMVYDPPRNRLLMLVHRAMWSWDGTTWTNVAPAIDAELDEARLAYDVARNLIVLVGRTTTWTWNGTTSWVRYPTSVALGLGSATYDNARGHVLFVGASLNLRSLWRWTGSTWIELAGPPNPAHYLESVAFDAVRGKAILFGGGTVGQEFSDTWAWNGTAWSRAAAPLYPTNTFMARTVTDTVAGRLLVFAPNSTYDKVEPWAREGDNWRLFPFGVSPTLHAEVSTVFDAKRNQVVRFGGGDGNDALGERTVFGETWIWTEAGWTQRFPARSPPPRMSAAAAYDAARENVVIFGGNIGVAVPGDPIDPFGDTWTWDGTTWTPHVVTPSPPARGRAMMAYDPIARNVVLFGGDAILFEHTDTWLWNGSSWTAAMPPLSPPATKAFSNVTELIYHPKVQRVGLFGLRDIWLWSGARWSRVPPPFGAGPPDFSNFFPPGHDPMHGSIFFGDWSLVPLGDACTANADCPNAFCADGACCQVSSCGPCETCNGISPGQCTPVTNAEDADSCALSAGRSCDALGVCRLALGASATDASQCASGHVVDGVCCDTTCEGRCLACKAELKESGTRSGICDNAKSGADPHDSCPFDDAASCKRDGQCDGHGDCRLFPPGAACGAVTCSENRATGLVCNGFGTCSVSASGVACGLYACSDATGCLAACETNAECGVRAHCESGSCLANEGASCDGDHTVVSPSGERQDCGAYHCEGAVCKTSCTRVNDCVFPAQCTQDSKCVAFASAPGEEGGCRASPRRSVANGSALALAVCGIVLARRQSRARARVKDRA